MELKSSDICKVLSVETRLKIIKLLKTQGPLGAKTIAESLGVTPAAASQHLKILSQIGLVTSERKGFFIPYSLDEAVLRQCRKLLTETCLCGCGDSDPINPGFLQLASLEELKGIETDLQNKLHEVRERIKDFNKHPQ